MHVCTVCWKYLMLLVLIGDTCSAEYLAEDYLNEVCPIYSKVMDNICLYLERSGGMELVNRESLCEMSCEGLIIRGLYSVPVYENVKRIEQNLALFSPSCSSTKCKVGSTGISRTLELQNSKD
uniref:Saposin B-type domain-containing protein n=1 Tax=Glossina austeni TaxID=7395 RepID=A0A1A9US41_GLOAU